MAPISESAILDKDKLTSVARVEEYPDVGWHQPVPTGADSMDFAGDETRGDDRAELTR